MEGKMVMDDRQKITEQMIYLIRCYINGENIILPKDFEIYEKKIITEAERHLLSVLVSYALKSAGLEKTYLNQEIDQAVRKMAIMEHEKNKVLGEFEKEGIWYAVLKGALIKECYPKMATRQMADYDILIDESHADDVKRIMQERGFEISEFGIHHHDVYIKKPVTDFEMHRKLFPETHILYGYYKNVKEKLIKDENNLCGYHFSKEDLYIYLIAHEYSHFALYNGIGLRALVDTYLYLRKYMEEMDMEYVLSECKKLNIHEFEQKNRNLSLHLFCNEQLTKTEEEMLFFFLNAGAGGSKINRMAYKINEFGGGLIGKVKYIWFRLFPGMRWVKIHYPFIYRFKIFLFFIPIFRLISAITSNKKVAIKELDILLESKNTRAGKK